MIWSFLTERLASALGERSAPFSLPRVVFELQPSFVAGARIEGALKPPGRIAVRELSSRALEPVLNRPNVTNEKELAHALRGVRDMVGNGSGRLGLLVPDAAMRVASLTFETLPESFREAEALVRWRMKESLPFAPEEARISFQVMHREPQGVEVLAVAAKNSVLAEYEKLLEPMNGGPALLLPATVALLPLLPATSESAHFLIHICSGWMTSVVEQAGRVRLWRSRQLEEQGPEELLKQIGAEAARVLATSRDHFGLEVGRIWFAMRPPHTEDLEPELARATSCEVSQLLLDTALLAGLKPADQLLFQRFGAPVAGVVSNAR